MADKKGNTGYRNTGYRNTGDMNTGNYNNGDSNTGSCNTGYRNTGNMNTGNMNTGSWNTGNWNTGVRNTGSWNTGDWNTGDLNTTKPTVRLFNKDSGLEFNGEVHIKIRNTVSSYQKMLGEWVYEKNMTDQEKTDNPTYKTTGGYLKVNKSVYNGKKVTKEHICFLESLPNFCPKILKECTGIDLEEKTCNNKIVEIDGKKYKLMELK